MLLPGGIGLSDLFYLHFERFATDAELAWAIAGLLDGLDERVWLMPEPTVITDLVGGHLALMVRMDEYVSAVRDFIEECVA